MKIIITMSIMGFPGGASLNLPASTGDIRDVGSVPR